MVEFNVVLVGVGGQGVMLLSELIAETAILHGLKIAVSQQKGLAQRGGSIKAFVRVGDVKTPLIDDGSADFVLALELAESLRALRYLNGETKVILNTQRVESIDVYLGTEKYPSES